MNGVSFTRSFSSSRTGKQKLTSYAAGAAVDIEDGTERSVLIGATYPLYHH